MPQISFNLFSLEDRRLLSEFLRKQGWFQGDNEQFPKYLGWKLKFQKTEKNSLPAREKTWKCIFNINSELSQKRTEKQIMPFKTALNWLFNDMWCYLVIDSFDWRIGIFQQTVVRGILYP